MKKTKVLVIADSPLVPSGVGIQTRYMIESLLKTGEYSFFCLAGAIRHNDYRMQKTEEWGDDLLILPVDGYGNHTIVRTVLKEQKPDIVWFMTDPRFFVWLWEIENEIRKNVPMVYYHVWDNYPYPNYNKVFYDSNDLVCTISKVTDDIVRTVSPETKVKYIPHTVNTEIYKKNLNSFEVGRFRDLITKKKEKMVFLWNNRNARRKLSGTLIYWFKDFLDVIGHDNACLLMHTHPADPHGQDLKAICQELNLTDDQVIFSVEKLEPHHLSNLYSCADCTINISDAEGFGLATLESLACETPIIVNMTGGLQEQVTNGSQWFGYGIEPCSKAVIGSQDVPYIYEDRISGKVFVDTLIKFYNLPKSEREQMGRLGRQHVLQNYSLEQYSNLWVETFDEIRKTMGSWDTRKNYTGWYFGEIT